MHTGFISFCDRVCNNIKSLDTKDIILQDLQTRFDIQILQRHWHKLDEKGIQHIRRIPHYACLRSNGNPYYMFISKYEDVPIIFYVDKKVQPGYQKPRIILGRGMWDEQLSSGTLFDGEMVKKNDNSWVFLINDLIAYNGKHLFNEQLPNRLKLAQNILETMHTPNKTLDTCAFEVKRYTNATQQGVQALVEWSEKLEYTSRGIYYWPFMLKYKPKLHNFDESLIRAVSVKVKDNPEFRTVLPETTTGPESPTQSGPASPVAAHVEPEPEPLSPLREGDTRKLWLRKTEFPDVYDIYPTDNGLLMNNKLGIAYIKTLDDSRNMREIFKTATVAMYIPMLCKKSDSKWIPLRRGD
jgi:mRNA capping enzyme, catalytic domain